MKVCNCLNLVKIEDSKFIGVQKGVKTFNLALYNCPICGTTYTVREYLKTETESELVEAIDAECAQINDNFDKFRKNNK